MSRETYSDDDPVREKRLKGNAHGDRLCCGTVARENSSPPPPEKAQLQKIVEQDEGVVEIERLMVAFTAGPNHWLVDDDGGGRPNAG